MAGKNSTKTAIQPTSKGRNTSPTNSRSGSEISDKRSTNDPFRLTPHEAAILQHAMKLRLSQWEDQWMNENGAFEKFLKEKWRRERQLQQIRPKNNGAGFIRPLYTSLERMSDLVGEVSALADTLENADRMSFMDFSHVGSHIGKENKKLRKLASELKREVIVAKQCSERAKNISWLIYQPAKLPFPYTPLKKVSVNRLPPDARHIGRELISATRQFRSVHSQTGAVPKQFAESQAVPFVYRTWKTYEDVETKPTIDFPANLAGLYARANSNGANSSEGKKL